MSQSLNKKKTHSKYNLKLKLENQPVTPQNGFNFNDIMLNKCHMYLTYWMSFYLLVNVRGVNKKFSNPIMKDDPISII